MTRRLSAAVSIGLATSLVALTPTPAAAFCGFYVSGADQSLYSNATMVVLMRDGQRTVLSMQNNYQGPPEAFAMVVPVPVVLQEENVKTLPREVFNRIDALAAPRLVEYWEEDPCQPQYYAEMAAGGPVDYAPMAAEEEGGADLGVRVEAQFAVGEYDIVILSANDSSGLETWLRRERYNIPAGASQVLRPYVESGTKFFVARVDVSRVTFENGRALLSPLRVHYDTPEFALPVRLGLLSSSGQQDLIVHILARNTRYEVANYRNAVIPTNIRVRDSVRNEFGSFYEYLFRETTRMNPRTVVTEYSWDANSCDPCPTPPLEPHEVMTLGGDVVSGDPYGFVLTRLHYRYGRDDLGEDLVFREAPALMGGTGVPAADGSMMPTQRGEGAYSNQFQGRYVILHPWEGAVSCANPQRGQWGGPPAGGGPRTEAATNTALTQGIPASVPDGAQHLAEEVSFATGVSEGGGGGNQARPVGARGGCAGCSLAEAGNHGLTAVILAAVALIFIRRRR